MPKKTKERILEISENGIFVRTEGEPPFRVKADKLLIKRALAYQLAFNPGIGSPTKLAGFEALDMYHKISENVHCGKSSFCSIQAGHPGPCFDNLHDVEIYPDEKSRAGADWANLYITSIKKTDGHEIWEGRSFVSKKKVHKPAKK